VFLENAQQVGLCRRVELGDLVEKQRTVVGVADEADAVRIGTRERALAVSEQLGRKDGAGDGATPATSSNSRPRSGTSVRSPGAPSSNCSISWTSPVPRAGIAARYMNSV
jgi:hypothetical protein